MPLHVSRQIYDHPWVVAPPTVSPCRLLTYVLGLGHAVPTPCVVSLLRWELLRSPVIIAVPLLVVVGSSAVLVEGGGELGGLLNRLASDLCDIGLQVEERLTRKRERATGT